MNKNGIMSVTFTFVNGTSSWITRYHLQMGRTKISKTDVIKKFAAVCLVTLKRKKVINK